MTIGSVIIASGDGPEPKNRGIGIHNAVQRLIVYSVCQND